MKRINLIPSELRKTLAPIWIKRYLLTSYSTKLITAILFLFFLTFMVTFYTLQRYKQKIILTKKQINKLELELINNRDAQIMIEKDKDRIKEENRYIQKKLFYLEKSRTERVKWSELLQVLNKLVLGDLWLSKISFNKDIVVINGTTIDNAKVSDFMLKIDESGYFKSTNFNFTQRNKEKVAQAIIDFEVTTHLVKY